jgi:hypothetical protein
LKNHQKTLIFDDFFVDFGGFSNFLQFWLKTSAKTDYGSGSFDAPDTPGGS